jgi:hypothetical protein
MRRARRALPHVVRDLVTPVRRRMRHRIAQIRHRFQRTHSRGLGRAEFGTCAGSWSVPRRCVIVAGHRVGAAPDTLEIWR